MHNVGGVGVVFCSNNVVANFLAQRNALKVLRLGDSQVAFGLLFGAMARGTCPDLGHFDISNNKFNPKTDLKPMCTYFSAATNLRQVD